MLTKGQFDVLFYLHNNSYTSQRELAEAVNYSLGKINSIVNGLKDDGLIDDNFKITKKGYESLKPYKVDNAIIMAAGMSSRFVPLSIEKPKGMLVVKNEVLIEREIEQLQEAGITDITLVLGYKKEAFFYLEDKYGVKLIINPEYNVKNNIESLYLAQERFGNTYICSSDNYFCENVFEEYVYTSYYSAIHVKEHSNEWFMIPDEKNNVKKVQIAGEDGKIMLGHVFWNREFSTAMKALINEHHDIGDYDSKLWESLFADNIKKLPPMYIREFPVDVIHEFDSLDELRAFDQYYIQDAHSKILKVICKQLKCKEVDILNFKPIKEGMTNTSFIFEVFGNKYVYRHPGDGTEAIISREHEKSALEIASEMGIESTYIAMDGKAGWKISKYVPDIRIPDYKNFDDSKRVVKVLKELHSKNKQVDWEFLPWDEALKIEEILRKGTGISLPDFDELKSNVEKCYKKTIGDGVERCFCHCDTYAPNWMFTDTETILIDWEYAGNADPGCDVGGYIMDAMYDIEEGKRFILEYLGEENETLIYHYMAYTALISYYWFVWALYRESCGAVMGESLHNWYVMAKRYSKYLVSLE